MSQDKYNQGGKSNLDAQKQNNPGQRDGGNRQEQSGQNRDYQNPEGQRNPSQERDKQQGSQARNNQTQQGQDRYKFGQQKNENEEKVHGFDKDSTENQRRPANK